MKRPVKPDIFMERILSDIRVGELDPREIKDLKEFVNTSDFEKTITAKTKLSVVYGIVLSEKEKKRKSKEAKKAEKILGAAVTQTFWEITRKRGYERDGQKRSKLRKKWELKPSEQAMNPMKNLKTNLKKLGIVKDEVIGKILDVIKKAKKLSCEIDAIGELNARVKMVLDSFKAHMDYARKVFSTQPKLLALPDKEFDGLIKSMKIEIKKLKPEGAM